MSTDRELLELAAKAAGLVGYQYCESWDGMAKYLNVIDGFDRDSIWRPHKDDGDALRLAVALVIDISPPRIEGDDAKATALSGKAIYQEDDGGSGASATRRAIVRAAAEIGKAMP